MCVCVCARTHTHVCWGGGMFDDKQQVSHCLRIKSQNEQNDSWLLGLNVHRDHERSISDGLPFRSICSLSASAVSHRGLRTLLQPSNLSYLTRSTWGSTVLFRQIWSERQLTPLVGRHSTHPTFAPFHYLTKSCIALQCPWSNQKGNKRQK